MYWIHATDKTSPLGNIVKKIRGEEEIEEMEEEWQKRGYPPPLKPGYLSVFHTPKVCPP